MTKISGIGKLHNFGLTEEGPVGDSGGSFSRRIRRLHETAVEAESWYATRNGMENRRSQDRPNKPLQLQNAMGRLGLSARNENAQLPLGDILSRKFTRFLPEAGTGAAPSRTIWVALNGFP